MLDNYYKSAKERADMGIPPLPLDAEQTSQLVELIKPLPLFPIWNILLQALCLPLHP